MGQFYHLFRFFWEEKTEMMGLIENMGIYGKIFPFSSPRLQKKKKKKVI